MRSPLKFLLLLVALSVPFWVLEWATPVQLLPGLPLSGLMAFCPMLAAMLLVYGEDRRGGVIELLRRSFDYERIGAKVWYLPTLFLMPGVMLLSYAVMRLMGTALPAPQFTAAAVAAMAVGFFAAALGEELGWSGYATEPMQERWGALGAGVLLGLAWAAWHLVPFAQAQRSPQWIAWQCVETVASRVLIVWIYNNAGRSIFAAALYHATLNLSQFLFPVYGSHYDPRVTGLILAFAAASVAVVWGPRTLARLRTP